MCMSQTSTIKEIHVQTDKKSKTVKFLWEPVLLSDIKPYIKQTCWISITTCNSPGVYQGVLEWYFSFFWYHFGNLA